MPSPERPSNAYPAPLEPESWSARVVQHLAEIGAGRCRITDEHLERATDAERHVLVGLLTLHEDLAYERRMRADSERERVELIAHLRSAVSARDDFLSIASHELRTPLTTLTLQSDALEQWLDGNDLGEHATSLRARASILRRQVKRLTRLIDELLDVSRLARGRLDLDRARVDLRVIVEEVLERRAMEGHEQVLIDRKGIESVFGEWDASRIDQVVTNLISNAIRYGLGRPVTIQTAAVEGGARLVVSDDGIGIAAADQPRIFDQFFRAASSSHYGGLGLGLWIVKQIVEAHGGRTGVESEQGRGTKVDVWLPTVP